MARCVVPVSRECNSERMLRTKGWRFSRSAAGLVDTMPRYAGSAGEHTLERDTAGTKSSKPASWQIYQTRQRRQLLCDGLEDCQSSSFVTATASLRNLLGSSNLRTSYPKRIRYRNWFPAAIIVD